MVNGILFKDKRFETIDDNNFLCPLTENTIILCNNRKMMHKLAAEIVYTINGEMEFNDYDCDDEDVGKARIESSFGLRAVVKINEQKITLCLEPAMIYKAEQIEDIWFYDCQKGDSYYREQIYPLTIFQGSHDVWDEGKDKVYEMIVSGRYGTYDGNWIDFKEAK